jgi:AraC family transcriptional regulator
MEFDTIPRIQILPMLHLVGKRMSMSLQRDATSDLWRSVMSNRNEAGFNPNASLYSLQVYDEDYIAGFNPARQFEKWALIGRNDINQLPADFETFLLPEGMYALFQYRGEAIHAPRVYGHIFSHWLPSSGYELDNRPHFEAFDMKYNPVDPNAVETICIPVRSVPT